MRHSTAVISIPSTNSARTTPISIIVIHSTKVFAVSKSTTSSMLCSSSKLLSRNRPIMSKWVPFSRHWLNARSISGLALSRENAEWKRTGSLGDLCLEEVDTSLRAGRLERVSILCVDAWNSIRRISKRRSPSLRATPMNPSQSRPCKPSVNGCWTTRNTLTFPKSTAYHRWARRKRAFPTSKLKAQRRRKARHRWTCRILFEQLQQSFLQAIALSPEQIDCDLQVCLGVLFHLLCDYEKAAECFQTAVLVKPEVRIAFASSVALHWLDVSRDQTSFSLCRLPRILSCGIN